MSELTIITNHNHRCFLYGHEVPEAIMADQFDHLDEGEQHDGFIHYRNYWYHVSDFMRIANHPDSEFSSWHGYASDSFFSGVLIRLTNAGDSYQIGTYIS